MVATYGYQDAEGEFYITVDTGRCAVCAARPCVTACPHGVLVVEEDPYGETVVALDDGQRRKLKYACSGCKLVGDRPPLPCVTACPAGAMSHSW